MCFYTYLKNILGVQGGYYPCLDAHSFVPDCSHSLDINNLTCLLQTNLEVNSISLKLLEHNNFGIGLHCKCEARGLPLDRNKYVK